MFKKLWEKFLTWWNASKIKPIFDKIGKVIRQFLRYAYAAQISYLVLAVIFYLTKSNFLTTILLTWGVILLIAEYSQQKAEKLTELNPQPDPPKPNVPVEVAKPISKKTKK